MPEFDLHKNIGLWAFKFLYFNFSNNKLTIYKGSSKKRGKMTEAHKHGVMRTWRFCLNTKIFFL